jgi:threonine dehydrogenase-like Zn-dependent dehydrogenase
MSTKYPMAYVTAPGKITFRQHTPHPIGPHDVQIRVKAVTLCGSDLHIFKGKHPAVELPIPVGHEIAGDVVEIGSEVRHRKIGDRVAIEPVLACGNCYFCQRGDYSLCTDISFQYRRGQGGITPFFVAPEKWTHLLPDHVSYVEGALFEPLSVAIHAVKTSGAGFDHTSAIFGSGAIGLLVLQVLLHAGVREIYMVDIDDYRLDTALRLGANLGFNNLDLDAVQAILGATDGLGVDRSFEAVGLGITLTQALNVLKKGGKATLVGLFEQPTVELPANLFVQKEISLAGSQGYCWDFQTAIKLAQFNRVDLKGLITHELSFERTQDAFEILADPNSKAIKVAILMEM